MLFIALRFFYEASPSCAVIMFVRNSQSAIGSRNPPVQFSNISSTKIKRLSIFFSAKLEVTGKLGPTDKNNFNFITIRIILALGEVYHWLRI